MLDLQTARRADIIARFDFNLKMIPHETPGHQMTVT